MKDFRKLDVWGKAHHLALEVYRATNGFPAQERYGLTSQMRRAATSIPTNIAEGCGRGGDAELGRFLGRMLEGRHVMHFRRAETAPSSYAPESVSRTT